jgi:hypothetical protein
MPVPIPWLPWPSSGGPDWRRAAPSAAAPSCLGQQEDEDRMTSKVRSLVREGVECGGLWLTCVVRSTVLQKAIAAQPNGFWLSYSPHIILVFPQPMSHSYFTEATAQANRALILSLTI